MTPPDNLRVAALLREFVEWLECPWDHAPTHRAMLELAEWLETGETKPFPFKADM